MTTEHVRILVGDKVIIETRNGNRVEIGEIQSVSLLRAFWSGKLRTIQLNVEPDESLRKVGEIHR